MSHDDYAEERDEVTPTIAAIRALAPHALADAHTDRLEIDADGIRVVLVREPVAALVRDEIEMPGLIYVQVAPDGHTLRVAHTNDGLHALLDVRREIVPFVQATRDVDVDVASIADAVAERIHDRAAETRDAVTAIQAAQMERDDALRKLDQRRAGSRVDVEWRASGAGELAPSPWFVDADEARRRVERHRIILSQEGRGGESVLESRTVTVGPAERVHG